MTQTLSDAFLAQYYLRVREFDKCTSLCENILVRNPYDQAAWYMKARSVTLKTQFEEPDLEDEAPIESLLDQNALSSLPRPGTSLRPSTGKSTVTSAVPNTAMRVNKSVRPVSISGRPVTGFARPGTTSIPLGTSSGMARLATATRMTATASGRLVRLNTASLVSEPGGPFIEVEKLDLRKYASRPTLARLLFDYIFYQCKNPRKALELASFASEHEEYKDWWWKVQLGRCYFRLGLYRDAERQMKSSLKDQDMISTYEALGAIYLKLDQPKAALGYYEKCVNMHPNAIVALLGCAQIHEQMCDFEESTRLYKEVLAIEPANVEALASIASNYFYTDRPEIALRFYRRLLQVGEAGVEIFNNLGICSYYAQQFDMALGCFDRALSIAANDAEAADVWYNLGQVMTGTGELNLAARCYQLAIHSSAGTHAEAYNNLAVLLQKKGDMVAARSNYGSSIQLGPQLYEPCFNAAVLTFKQGNYQVSYENCLAGLAIYPDHVESNELLAVLKEKLSQN